MTPRTWSISALSVELGIDRRTLARKLEGLSPVEEKTIGKRIERLYRMRDVFRHMANQEEKLDYNHERAKLVLLQQERLRMQIDEEAGDLVSLKLVREYWHKLLVAARTVATGIPNRVAPLVAGLSPREAFVELDREIKSFLQALAHDGIPAAMREKAGKQKNLRKTDDGE